MAITHDLKRLFWHVIRLENAPIIHFAETTEQDPPFRRSPYSVIVRLWPTNYGLVLGFWFDRQLSAEEAELASVAGFTVDLSPDVDLEDPHIRDQVRANVAKAADNDPEKEWMVLSYLGLDKDKS